MSKTRRPPAGAEDAPATGNDDRDVYVAAAYPRASNQSVVVVAGHDDFLHYLYG